MQGLHQKLSQQLEAHLTEAWSSFHSNLQSLYSWLLHMLLDYYAYKLPERFQLFLLFDCRCVMKDCILFSSDLFVIKLNSNLFYLSILLRHSIVHTIWKSENIIELNDIFNRVRIIRRVWITAADLYQVHTGTCNEKRNVPWGTLLVK